MMRIAVADDEYWARVTLISMLKELDLPLEIVGEAGNGQEMARMTASARPDLVFVDIKMPGLNGLDGIRLARQSCPDTVWIVVSGFSEFAYAREAIGLGVLDYLLKPVNPQMLREKVMMAEEAVRERIQKNCLKFRNALLELTDKAEHDRGVDEVTEEDGWEYMAVAFQYDSAQNAAEQLGYHSMLLERMKHCLDGIHTSGTSSTMFISPKGGLVAAVKLSKRIGNQQELIREGLYQATERGIRRISDEKLVISAVGLSGKQSQKELVSSLKNLENLFYCRLLAGIGRFYTEETLEKRCSGLSEAEASVCRRAESLMAGFKSGDYQIFMQHLKELRTLINSISLNEEKDGVLQKYLSLMGAGGDSTENMLKRLEQQAFDMLASNKRKECSGRGELINAAKAYIQAHYTEDIGAAQVAELLNVTPNYLSSLFHRQEHTTLMKYLTGLRMERAAFLLRTRGGRLKEIAAGSGYGDSRYFIRVFKEFYGMTPTEYMKSVTGQDTCCAETDSLEEEEKNDIEG